MNQILSGSPLFAGFAPAEIKQALSCLLRGVQNYPAHSYLFHAGDPADRMGLVLSGSLHIIQEDFWGRRTILTQLGPGELFGEAFALGGTLFPISAFVAEDSQLLLLDANRLRSPCSTPCFSHNQLFLNLLLILSRKNISLTEKMFCLTQRTTREKLLFYLSSRAEKAGSPRFSIPFNRQELADYLSVNRSALSEELGRLRDEGLLTFHRNTFELFLQ